MVRGWRGAVLRPGPLLGVPEEHRKGAVVIGGALVVLITSVFTLVPVTVYAGMHR